ncbi:hypothetical protein EUX98_g8397 [Antrodiella citrinella]|uniref:Cell division control protein 14 n=1 Tax=Antrodiella citrinella TaxID=2447956 RepID=A0A4S4M8C9_9APHY|nr:hypothetical protein EUX98_g8397 [Antrodiella citrinella]
MGTRIMQDTIMDALDDLSSSHVSTTRKGRALDSLEKLLAEICGTDLPDTFPLQYFIALQDTFQCNIPSRLLTWLSESTYRLEALVGKGTLEADKESEAHTLSNQLWQGLTIVQGIALQHPASKKFLSRRYALDTLLDLLLVSRHVSNPVKVTGSVSTAESKQAKSAVVTLTDVALDSLLCVLVDSSEALRTFEEANGVQYVVRILKRAGTPREVRMKCLEFLYFYLMDETITPSAVAANAINDTDLVPTAPNSPVKPSSRSTTQSSISSDRSSSSSSFSTDSGSSIFSNSTYASSFSASSFSGTSTPKDSMSPTATRKSTPFPIKQSPRIFTPPSAAKPRSLALLKKDVDYTPMSPKKAQVSKLGLGVPHLHSRQREVLSSEDNTDPEEITKSEPQTPKSRSPFDVLSPEKLSSRPGHRRGQLSMDVAEVPVPIRPPIPSVSRPLGTRTIEEKKEILGGMLGNVDALVEGVRKAGVWGLG